MADGGSSRVPKAVRGRAWSAFAAGAIALAGGCAGVPVEHGRTGVVAAYEWDGVLRARVGEECDPASVGAAARGALRTRGYAILEHKTNQGFTRVCGGESRVEPWDRLWARTVTVEARPRGAETEISVRVQPVGEEGESRAVLVEMLSLLGL